jgi:hypothetical protein
MKRLAIEPFHYLVGHQQMNQLLQKRVKELEAMVNGLQMQLIKMGAELR